MTINLFRNQILNGHVLDKLKELPDESVHCVVTSPPYWGLRQYGEKAKHNLWLIEKLERKEEGSIKPEYNVTQAKLVYAVAILMYIISLTMTAILSPY